MLLKRSEQTAETLRHKYSIVQPGIEGQCKAILDITQFIIENAKAQHMLLNCNQKKSLDYIGLGFIQQISLQKSGIFKFP